MIIRYNDMEGKRLYERSDSHFSPQQCPPYIPHMGEYVKLVMGVAPILYTVYSVQYTPTFNTLEIQLKRVDDAT